MQAEQCKLGVGEILLAPRVSPRAVLTAVAHKRIERPLQSLLVLGPLPGCEG